MKDVQNQTENVNTEVDPSGWRPYYTFVDGLNDKYAKNEGFQGNDSPSNCYNSLFGCQFMIHETSFWLLDSLVSANPCGS